MTHASFTFGRARRRAALGAALGVIMLMSVGASATGPRFYDDDPIAREEDPQDASGVQPFEIHLFWDLLDSLFGHPGDPVERRAMNVNTIDEVPDSSWFTNRVGTLPLTERDVWRGPDTTGGPAAGIWTVVAGKSAGIRPGFTIVDRAGVRWFLKFDPPGYPHLATSAEVVSTQLFWALGYNVAETHVATLRPEGLAIAEGATLEHEGQNPRRLTIADIRQVLARAARSPDGTYRVLASKAIEGKPLGGFRYYGTRSDDPNDVVPHEHRRELRAMRVFAAWVNRVDAKAGNTLDTLITEHGKGVVRHYVLDFGSTLGSAGIGPRDYEEGYEYIYQGGTTLKGVISLGFDIQPWRVIRYHAPRSVGRFEADHFAPETWRPRVPNAAYLRARSDDTFWAARKLTAVTDGMIAAAVKRGRYTDAAAERYLIDTLIERRAAILRTYLTRINPVVSPSLDASGILNFENAAVQAGVAAPPSGYRMAWFAFDNTTGESTPIGEHTAAGEARFHAPTGIPTGIGSFVRVDISAENPPHPSWSIPVHAYFRRTRDGWTLVGLERLPEQPVEHPQETR